MKKILRIITMLVAITALSEQASAQVSGFASVDTYLPGPVFSARLGINYALTNNSPTAATIGLRAAVIGSSFGVTALGIISSPLSQNLSIGAALIAGFSSNGVVSAFEIIFRPFASLELTRSETLALAATLSINTVLLPSFALQPWLALDGVFLLGDVNGAFGIRAILTLSPNVVFDGITTYAHLNYILTPDLRIFAGTALLINNGLAWSAALYQGDFDYKGIYAGLQYNLADAFALRFTTGYIGGVFFTLTGILR
jgi:hypothetical protein